MRYQNETDRLARLEFLRAVGRTEEADQLAAAAPAPAPSVPWTWDRGPYDDPADRFPPEPGDDSGRLAEWLGGRASAEPSEGPAALLAVYGTLRAGQPNFGFLAGCESLGPVDLPGLGMWAVCGGRYPIASPRPGCTVRAELYAVGPDALAAIDRLEVSYSRQWVRTADGRDCLAFLADPRDWRGSDPRPIHSGDWRDRPPIVERPIRRLAARRTGRTVRAGLRTSPDPYRR